MRWLYTLVASVSVLACNAIVGFNQFEKTPDAIEEPPPDDADGGPTKPKPDSGPVDGGNHGPPGCNPDLPFQAPVALPAINSASTHDGSPTLSGDELTIIWGRIAGTSDGSLLISKRTAFDQNFGEAVLVPGIPDTKQNFAPTLTDDGLNLFWSVETNDGTTFTTGKIFRVTRADRNSEFSSPEEMIPSSQLRLSPHILRDGTELYYTFVKNDNDGQIWRAKRMDFGMYEEATLVTELSSTGANAGIATTPDGLRIYFASSRPGSEGGNDIYTATRATRDAAWENVAKVPELSSPKTERPGYISPDGCRFYLSSDRDGEGTLYMASKPL